MRMRTLMSLGGYELHKVSPDIQMTAFAPTPMESATPRATDRKTVTPEEAIVFYNKLGYEFDFTEFVMGMEVELEHDDITQGNLEMTAKIVAAHLREIPTYYTLLKKYVEKSDTKR
jgi:hypothetical protein